MMVFRGRTRRKTGFWSGLPPQNLDVPPPAPYTSAAPLMDVILNPRAARKALSEVPGMAEDFEEVAALRTDGQEPASGPQGQPFQHQDQAPVPAEPVQRHLHFRRAWPQRALKGVDQRDQERRPPRRPRCVFAEGKSGRAVAARAGAEAGDREEDGQGRAREEGGVEVFSARCEAVVAL